jgi:hypothetical protein
MSSAADAASPAQESSAAAGPGIFRRIIMVAIYILRLQEVIFRQWVSIR